MTRTDLLAADTAMGPVTLLVRDLELMTAFYRDAVLLDVLRTPGAASDQTVTLGRGSVQVMILEHHPDLAWAERGAAGLFHTAIVFESQAALAQSVFSVATRASGSFTGSADHLVSQAFYFTDPEGNGVELYWDRDRSNWSWTHGSIEMATLQLDPNRFLAEHLDLSAQATTTTAAASVGHVHLAVGDIASAHDFYVDRLGFETTARLGNQALFVSAGGYHHHMAMNTWGSRGAGPRTRALGLGRVEIVVPTSDDLGALAERMSHFGVQTRDDGRSLSFEDPWANLVRVEPSLASDG